MNASEFAKIRYGNIIKDRSSARKYAVTLVLRDKEEKPVHVALTPAIDATDALNYDVVSSDRIVSYLTAQTINETPVVVTEKSKKK